MKPRALFRLLLKLLGVYFFTIGFSSLIMAATQLIVTMQASSRFGAAAMGMSPYLYAQFAQPIIESLIGCYLFFGGEWIVQRAVPDSRPRCPECGYDLSHTGSDNCPECGMPLRSEPLNFTATP